MVANRKYEVDHIFPKAAYEVMPDIGGVIEWHHLHRTAVAEYVVVASVLDPNGIAYSIIALAPSRGLVMTNVHLTHV